MAYGKLLGAKMIEAPNILNKDGKQYINPPEELYLEYGYLPLEYTVIPNVAEGYHLVQSWIDMGNRLLQKWNYEADDDATLIQEIRELKEEISRLKQSQPGDYNNPIFYYQGLEIEDGKWYTNGAKMAKAIAAGTPVSFNDINYFDEQ